MAEAEAAPALGTNPVTGAPTAPAATAAAPTVTATTTTTETKADPTTAQPERNILKLATKETVKEGTEAPVDPTTVEPVEKRLRDAQAKITELSEQVKKGSAPAIPETYDFKPLTEAGLQFTSEEQQTQVTGLLKEAGVPQEQMAKLAPVAKAIGESNYARGRAEVMKEYGLTADPKAEIAKIQQRLGSRFEAVKTELEPFANSLPPELDILTQSDAGWQVIELMLKNSTGPNFINGNDTVAASPESMKADMQKLIRERNAAGGNTSKGKALDAQIDTIAKRMHGGR